MDHLAILSKKGKLLKKIISGEKTIESRWYKFKKTPYQNITTNDIVYFKESGEPVTVKSRVRKVLFFDHLDDYKIKQIFKKYAKQIGVTESYADEIKNKNFCTLVFFEDIQIIDSFNIDKTGFGLMSAWLTLEDIYKIKI